MIVRPGDNGWFVDSWYDVSAHRLEHIKAKILNKKTLEEFVINLFAWHMRARYNMGSVLHIRSKTPLTAEMVESLMAGDPGFIRRYRCRV